MASREVEVQHELVAIGFRAYPRALGTMLGFAAITVAFFWREFEPTFLLGWFAVFVAVGLVRLGVARAFFRQHAPVPDPEAWLRRSAIVTGATGLMWGVLAGVALTHAPAQGLYAMWAVFLIVLLLVLGAQTTASHPSVFRAFLAGGMVPVLVVSILEPSPQYAARLAGELLLFFSAWLVGRSGNRYIEASIAMRFENRELLADLERQKDELDRANAAKSRFLAAASHDLRQPMQALVLLVESLRERVKQPENQRLADGIHATIESMSSLLNEILDISRLEAGTVSPQLSSFPIAQVLDRLRAGYTLAAARKDLSLRVRDDDCVVKTDPVLLYRILVNLVENAVRYTRHGGVLVACRRRADGLWVEVWDTGVGIPADQHEAIFVEFHQVRNPHRDREQGFGLGLAIVRRMARLLNLDVQLRSRVGRGSVFRVRVPYGDLAEVRAPEPATPVKALEGCRVAILEDDAAIRDAMKVMLEGWNCEVHAVADGRELDALLKRLPEPPRVLIADYRLPGGEDGIDIVQRVRARHPGIAGILVSGDVSPPVLRAAREADIEMIHKPLRPARLRALLGALQSGVEVA